MKFTKVVLLLVLILASLSTSYSLDVITLDDYESVSVVFNGKTLKDDVSAKFVNGKLMLPMRAYFEILGSSVKWVDSTNEIISYKDNSFIKLKIGSKIAFHNGREFKLDIEPKIIDKSAYISAKFIAETFELKYNYDKSKKILNLDHLKSSVKFNFIKDDYFKRVPFDNLGVYISIPQFWEKNANIKNRYEFIENKMLYSIEASSVTLKIGQTLENYINQLKKSEAESYSSNITYTGSYEETINGIDATVISSIIKGQTKEIRFLIKENRTVYILKFNYSVNAPESDAIDTINLIAKSFQISNFTVNYLDEHYIEYNEFFNNDIKISQDLFSNMEVQGVMKFSGTTSKDTLLSGFKVTVSRLGQTKTFTIPIIDGEFDSNLYAPFGLGKHNVSIEAIWLKESDLSKSKISTNALKEATAKLRKLKTVNPKLLEFSFINLEIDKLEYLIPSEKIQKDDLAITSLSNVLTYNQLRKFDKAKLIFDWITKNISLKQSAVLTSTKNSIQVFDDEYGNNLEINILYSALLRSIDIPARVVLATNIEGTKYYYSELFLNGEWSASDPVAAIRFMNSENESNTTPYFLTDLEKYQHNFDKIEILNY